MQRYLVNSKPKGTGHPEMDNEESSHHHPSFADLPAPELCGTAVGARRALPEGETLPPDIADGPTMPPEGEPVMVKAFSFLYHSATIQCLVQMKDAELNPRAKPSGGVPVINFTCEVLR